MTRWYGLLIDIDDRKNMEEALRSNETRLSRATQTATVGEFSASIAHEINQPLAAVVANGHACLRWLSAEPPSLAKAIRGCRKDCSRRKGSRRSGAAHPRAFQAGDSLRKWRST